MTIACLDSRPGFSLSPSILDILHFSELKAAKVQRKSDCNDLHFYDIFHREVSKPCIGGNSDMTCLRSFFAHRVIEFMRKTLWFNTASCNLRHRINIISYILLCWNKTKTQTFWTACVVFRSRKVSQDLSSEVVKCRGYIWHFGWVSNLLIIRYCRQNCDPGLHLTFTLTIAWLKN